MSAQASERFAVLDGVRGVAALLVVGQHALEKSSPAATAFAHDWVNLGQLGVCLFLLVSGFVIPHSLERRASVRAFWWGRFFRLYPMFWFTLGLLALFGALRLAPFPLRPEDPALAPRDWLANMTMGPALLGAPPATYVFWTLTLELGLYGLYTLFFVFGVSRRSSAIALTTAGLIGLAVVIAPSLAPGVPVGWAFLVLTAFLGTAAFRWRSESSARRAYALAGLVACAGGLALWMTGDPGLLVPVGSGMPFTAGCLVRSWALAYLAFFGALAVGDRVTWSRPGPRALLALGTVSYSVYLLHPLIIAMLPVGSWGTAYPLAVAAVTLPVATLTYSVVERPALAFGRRFQKGGAN